MMWGQPGEGRGGAGGFEPRVPALELALPHSPGEHLNQTECLAAAGKPWEGR